ncbi:hypothetical protein BDB01DRAFT_780316 [Pilobolus umbonatus]|nr:hypothetical protein BDB01DRAFT_780316 [Pilobolus umbonatus]
MLRNTSHTVARTIPSWRSTLYSSARAYSTPVSESENVQPKKPSLSERLGGSGRGKVVEKADPFATFLANAKKPRENNRRNGNFTPRAKRQDSVIGQFNDAEERTSQTQVDRPPRTERTNNAQSRPVDGNQRKNSNYQASDNNNKNNRFNKKDNNNSNKFNNRKDKKFGARKQPDEVRTRRATIFIDKDIDWASFESDNTTPLIAQNEENASNDTELLVKDMEGEYDRYLSVGKDIEWPQMMTGLSVNTLIGSNPSLDIQQKTQFLSAVSSAVRGQPLARK